MTENGPIKDITIPLSTRRGIPEKQFLQALKSLNVPLHQSVPLLCRVKGCTLKAITEHAGYSRNSLYQALARGGRPKYALLQSVIDHLGVDPWGVYEEDAGGIDPESSENHSL